VFGTAPGAKKEKDNLSEKKFAKNEERKQYGSCGINTDKNRTKLA
jgi:hypothetical protein